MKNGDLPKISSQPPEASHEHFMGKSRCRGSPPDLPPPAAKLSSAKSVGKSLFLPALLLLALSQVAIGLPFIPLTETKAQAYMRSAFLGGWPGLCEDGQCYDDGTPISDPPPESKRRLLQHQLASPSCPTDLVYVTVQYPENTGSPALDKRLSVAMEGKFRLFLKRAMELSCNDFDGCSGHCLPVGMEIRQYVHQSSPNHMSIFEVERFIGNFRRNRHYRGTMSFSFANYSLETGRPLILKDIFLKPVTAVPKFWAKVDDALKSSDNCPFKDLLVSGRRISGKHLEATDFILTKGGATLALTTPKAGSCRSQAIDLDVESMLEIGADPALWGR